jgi:hypothetical protein
MLSVFMIPVLSSYSTSLNLLFFYMTWSTLVLSHTPLRVEIFGTIAVRLIFYALPSVLFFLFDILTPSAAVVVKKHGAAGLPGGKRRSRIRTRELKVAGWSLLNLCMSIAVQWGIETLCVRALGMRSALKVSIRLPMPYEMLKDLLLGLLGREVRFGLFPIDGHGLVVQFANITSFTGPHIRYPPLRPSFGAVCSYQVSPVLVSFAARSVPTDRAL